MNIATVDNMENVYANLASTLQQQGIDALLPVHVTPEQFTRTAANALVENSDLQFADKSSLVLALTRCARDGLLPDGREAALVVRKQKVAYMPMVDGVLKRARQSGQVANIVSKVVYDADAFKYWVDERGEHIKHVPRFEERGEIRLVYAFAKLTSGELVVEVMGRAEVDKVRATVTSSGKEGSPWVKWYDRMALKTVLHRLARRLPCAAEMFSLLEVGVTYLMRKNRVARRTGRQEAHVPVCAMC
jgi:recombination protein RecT